MDQLEAHVIPDSNAVLLSLGGSFFRPFRVLYGTPANGAIVTLISHQQGDIIESILDTRIDSRY